MAKIFSGAAVVIAFDIMFSRHIVRAGASAVGLDDCAAQMVLFLKLAHLCFAVYDGAGDLDRLRKNAKSDAKEGPAVHAKKAASGRLTRALSFVPSPVAVLGYAFNPTTAMAGPAFDFSVYTLAQDGLIVDDGKMRPLNDKERKNFALASPGWRITSGFVFGVLLMAGFSVGSSLFPIESLFNRSLAHSHIAHLAGEQVASWATPFLMGDEGTNPFHSNCGDLGLDLVHPVCRPASVLRLMDRRGRSLGNGRIRHGFGMACLQHQGKPGHGGSAQGLREGEQHRAVGRGDRSGVQVCHQQVEQAHPAVAAGERVQASDDGWRVESPCDLCGVCAVARRVPWVLPLSARDGRGCSSL